jgi:hypothetical protein
MPMRTAKSCDPVAPTLAISCADDVSAMMRGVRAVMSLTYSVSGWTCGDCRLLVCRRTMAVARHSLRPLTSEGEATSATRAPPRSGNAGCRVDAT